MQDYCIHFIAFSLLNPCLCFLPESSVEVAYAMIDPRTGRQRRVSHSVTVKVPAGV